MARLFDCFVLFFVALFFHCKLSVFILPVLSGLIFISDTKQVALPSTSSTPSSSGEGAEEWYQVCCVYCGVPFQSHTYPPSLLSAGACRLCLFYCGLGRAPVWAACHSPGYSMYSESCASFFFFFFLSCVVFFFSKLLSDSSGCGGCFVAFFTSGAFEASRPGVWVEVHCSERLIIEKCMCVFFLRFKVNMV